MRTFKQFHLMALPLLAISFPVHAEDICWAVYQTDNLPDGSAMAEEKICLNSEREGVVKESVFFGSEIEGCSDVTAEKRDDALVFQVDFAKCQGQRPSHKISCSVESHDVMRCLWTYSTGAHVGNSWNAYLLRDEEAPKPQPVAQAKEQEPKRARLQAGKKQRLGTVQAAASP